jgi:16S rRNA (guanine966-N2)-methyltransferase
MAVPLVRVVAGSAKGLRLAPVPRGVRPVSDMAREGVFSSLGELVRDARVLDLYAGTGAMAIEALSRGAEHAVLVERDRAALRTIRENVARARVAEAAEIVASDVGSFLMTDDKPLGGFDLILADPPYAIDEDELGSVLSSLGAGGLSGDSWRVVLTRPKRSSTPVIPVHWLPARRLSYGDTLVFIFREA